MGPGVEINTEIGEEFQVEQRSVNGSWLFGWAKTVGSPLVTATLDGILHPKLGFFKTSPKISAKNVLYIFPKITLDPAEVILPWDPHIRPK